MNERKQAAVDRICEAEENASDELFGTPDIVRNAFRAGAEQGYNAAKGKNEMTKKCVICGEWLFSPMETTNGWHRLCAEKELTGEIIPLCKCPVRRYDGSIICKACELPYNAEGSAPQRRHA